MTRGYLYLTMIGDSDLLTIYNAYAAWRRICTTHGTSELQFCRKNFLSPQNLSNIEELKAQLATSLLDAGFLKLDEGERMSIHKYVAIFSSYPNVHANMRTRGYPDTRLLRLCRWLRDCQ